MKILQIAYYYPPMGGAGVQRGLKFSRYLPLHGITPVVLAAHDPHYVRDESLLAEVPTDIDVERVEHSPWIARLAAWRRRTQAKAQEPVSAGASGDRGSALAPLDGSPWRDAALRAVRALQFPDDRRAWAVRALRRARETLRRHAAAGAPIELVFSSAPPASAHWLGERIAREAGLPWVADFRDLWTDNPAYDAPAWRRALDRRAEDRWLAQADGVVTVTPSWRDALAARRPGRPTAFIPNGYDEHDFSALAAPPPRDPGVVTLVHTGTFYGPRDPAGLLGGLARYLAGVAPCTPALRVRLVGNMGARFAASLQHFAREHPGVVETVPYQPHAGALAELVAADALLLVVGGDRGAASSGWLPGKLFEYLRSGQPVLTLGDPEGDAARLVRRHSSGAACHGDDAAAIATALAGVMALALRRRGETIGADAAAEPPTVFERRALSGQLADFLRDCRALKAARRR